MLTTIVKISNVTNLSDARYCAGMGVEMLGFTIDADHPNFVTPARFREIRSWVSGIQIIGETQSGDPETILNTLKDYPVDALEISSPDLLPYLRTELECPLLLRFDIDGHSPEDFTDILENYREYLAYFVMESTQDQPLTDEWLRLLRQLPPQSPVLLGFGLNDPEALKALMETVPVRGIALKGSAEIRPGYKDYGRLMDILEALEETD